MGWGGVVETELMRSLVGGDTERCCGKLKRCNRFLKPNFGTLPKLRKLSVFLATARLGLHGAVKFAEGFIPGAFLR
jgi:hypothetical protein